MHHLAKLLVVASASCTLAVLAEEVTITEELQAAMQDIAVHSKIVTLDGSGITPGNFKHDSDPTTLQIVMLAKPSDGAAQVSSDGEVIFLQKDTSETEQKSLFTTAFYLKAKAREVTSKPANAEISPGA